MVGPRLQFLEGFAPQSADSRVDLPVGMQQFLALLAMRGPGHRCVVAGSVRAEVPETLALAHLRTGLWRVNRMVPGLVRVEGMRLSMARTVPPTEGRMRALVPVSPRGAVLWLLEGGGGHDAGDRGWCWLKSAGRGAPSANANPRESTVNTETLAGHGKSPPTASPP